MNTAPLHSLGALLAAFTFVALSATASAQAKDPAEAAAQKPIPERILGHWVIDRNQMLKVMTERAAGEAGGAGLDAAEKEMIVEMLNQMMARMVLEVTADGIARVHSPQHEDDATYKILKEDETTGEFTLEVKPPEEEADIAEGKINGNLLSLKSDDMELHFRRLSEAQTKPRLAALKKVVEKEGEGKEDKGTQ